MLRAVELAVGSTQWLGADGLTDLQCRLLAALPWTDSAVAGCRDPLQAVSAAVPGRVGWRVHAHVHVCVHAASLGCLEPTHGSSPGPEGGTAAGQMVLLSSPHSHQLAQMAKDPRPSSMPHASPAHLHHLYPTPIPGVCGSWSLEETPDVGRHGGTAARPGSSCAGLLRAVAVVPLRLCCVVTLQDQRDQSYSTVKTAATAVTIQNLKPGTIYVFQIRASAAQDYGNYSPSIEVETLGERKCKPVMAVLVLLPAAASMLSALPSC